MAKFIFRLEPVLKDRDRTEKARLREWSVINKILGQLVAEKLTLENELQRAQSDYTGLCEVPRLLVGLLVESDRYIESIHKRIEWKRQEIQRAQKFVKRKYDEWMVARMRKQVLEKLKDRRQSEFKTEKKRLELRQIDDIYVMRDARGRRSENEDNL